MTEQEMEAPAPRRAMVIVAHPDDAEFGVAGTVALWVNDGVEVTYVLITDGNKGSNDPTMVPEQLAAIRRQEQRAAAAVIGVKEVVFLGYEDAVLEPTLELRRDLARVIRRYKPDAVICQDPSMRWAGQEYINHPDHRAAGEAALAAIYPAARDPLTFPELLLEGLQPHKVSEVYLMMPTAPDHWIDIGATLDLKLASLREHRSQIGEGTEEMIRRWAAEAARDRDGMEAAELYKYFNLR